MKTKTIEGVVLTPRAQRCLMEARRRYCMFAVRDGKRLDEAWIGLGAPSHYRDAIEAGIMAPLNGKETKRVDNWYLFTPLGIRVFAGWLALKEYL